MTKVITLQVEKQENGEVITSTKNFTVKKAKFKQIMEFTKEVDVIAKEIKASEDLKGLFSTLFTAQVTEDEEQEQRIDNDIISKAVGSFQVLAVHLPEHALKLLSILTGIDTETLEEQEPEMVLDVYDAAIEVNDIKKLIERLKKSLTLMKTVFKFDLPTPQAPVLQAQK